MRIETKDDLEYVQTNFMEVKHKLVNKYSPAETKFVKLLTNAGLYFIREKCHFKLGWRWSYYDFYIPLYNLYVEVDGSSHDNEAQKAIDREKEEFVKRKDRWVVRLTNDEVFALESITIDYLLNKLFEQTKTRKQQKNASGGEGRYWKVLRNMQNGERKSLADHFGDFVCEETEVWMYEDKIGEYFCFKSLADAKIATGLRMKDIINLADMQEYDKCSYRTHIFAYTKEDCIKRVYETYGW